MNSRQSVNSLVVQWLVRDTRAGNQYTNAEENTMNLSKLITRLAYVWIIIVGGLIIYPGGIIQCIVCERVGSTLIGLISMILGVAGLVRDLRSSDPMPGHR